MPSDSEDEDYAEYGSSLDPLDEDALPRKKPLTLMDQVARDKHGRRRFHGAFTGGFSAGFFNSVGSLEGWTPSTFKSSRSEKAAKSQQKPEDFMDEEDMGEFGIAPNVLRATSDFNSSSKKRERSCHISDGPIPGEPVLKELLQPVKETVGIKLLKKMGWKPGQGIGPRVTKLEKNQMKEDFAKSGTKLYGCSLPQDMNMNKHSEIRSTSSTDDEEDVNLTFAPDDLQPFLCKPKENCFGLGYSGLDKRPVLSSHINLFEPTPLKMEEKKKKISITGQAFGVGAFEDDDDGDIYAREDMSQYDFSLDTLPSTSKQKQKTNKVPLANYAGNALLGFILGTNSVTLKKYFPPPLLPQGFQPIHTLRKTRFEPISPTEQSKTDFRKKGLQRHILKATDRVQILNESVLDPSQTKENACNEIQEEYKRITAEALKITEKLIVSTNEGSTHFRPFVAHPEKQKRYEEYLMLSKLGQKDQLSRIQPLSMTEWEKEREKVEFEQAARLYQPLTGTMSDRFVSASQPEDMNNPLPIDTKEICKKDQRPTEKLKVFGRLTREETDWRPCSLLCKRFNIPELHPGNADESSTGPKKNVSKYSVFSFLDASSYNVKQNFPDISHSGNTDKVDSSQSVNSEITVKEESQFDFQETGSVIIDSNSEKKSEDAILEFPDPPAKIDLFKAIFLSSSSEDSDSESEFNSSKMQPNEQSQNTEVVAAERISEETVLANESLRSGDNNLRNTSPPRGVFANLDLDAINAHKKEKLSHVPDSNVKPTDSESNQIKNEVNTEKEQSSTTEIIDEDMYGPQLPTVPASVLRNNTVVPAVRKMVSSVISSVDTEWVEKTKSSHKDKHKKHKKSSKHKKHKHKKKRH